MARRAAVIGRTIEPDLGDARSVLDFGCGDLAVGEWLASARPDVAVTGVDVAGGAAPRAMRTTFVPYDGRTLPFSDGAFDASYAAFVLHHTTDPDALLRELWRVTRRRIVILEDVYRWRSERALLSLFDAGNLLAAPGMSLPFEFRSEEAWTRAFAALGHAGVRTTPIRPAFPKPTRHRKFVVDLVSAGP